MSPPRFFCSGITRWGHRVYILKVEQQVIVSEIEAEQKLVSANRELISRFEHKIQTTLARIWGEERNGVSPPNSLFYFSVPSGGSPPEKPVVD